MFWRKSQPKGEHPSLFEGSIPVPSEEEREVEREREQEMARKAWREREAEREREVGKLQAEWREAEREREAEWQAERHRQAERERATEWQTERRRQAEEERNPRILREEDQSHGFWGNHHCWGCYLSSDFRDWEKFKEATRPTANRYDLGCFADGKEGWFCDDHWTARRNS